MVNMIAGFRAYETNAKVVQTHDNLLDKAANEVARV
jgi:flagellar basal-body rod protein FlgG